MISYRIDVADVHAHLFQVTLTVPHPAAEQRISLPVWIPGSYLVREFARHLSALDARQGDRTVSLRQLDKAMELISREGTGILIYLRQEGRGIGLDNKLKAYELQDLGKDTVEANESLGFKPDHRNYGTGASILYDLGIRRIRLLTNNPAKRSALHGYGLEIVETVALKAVPNPFNEKYLQTKRDKLGHLI